MVTCRKGVHNPSAKVTRQTQSSLGPKETSNQTPYSALILSPRLNFQYQEFKLGSVTTPRQKAALETVAAARSDVAGSENLPTHDLTAREQIMLQWPVNNWEKR